MTLPATIRVGPSTYTVLTDPEKIKQASDEANIGSNAEWVAFSDHDALIIGINSRHHPDAQRSSLLHEVLHCCLRFSGAWPNAYAALVAKAKGRHDGYTVEEFVISALTGPLLMVLLDNPSLLDADNKK